MFSSLSEFSPDGKDGHSIASKLEGGLLIASSTFPYFMLVALEAGGPIRALILLLISPVLCLLERLSLQTAAIQVMIFVSLAGLKLTDVKTVANCVLPRFYLQDIRSSAFRVFSSCGGKRYVATSMPRIMTEAFLREYLNVDCVNGTELSFVCGYCTGLVAKPDLMGSYIKRIDIGLGDLSDHHPIKSSCQERYIVPVDDEASPLHITNYAKPLIFHDGRLVARPTPLNFLAVILWLPLGLVLAISRLLIGNLLPRKLGIQIAVAAATGMSIRSNSCTYDGSKGAQHTLYVCSHRTLIDPVIVAAALQRPVTAVTYSVSRISELVSPIRTVRLSRDRVIDGETMQELLKQGDLVVCPEGTTCREPYLLRFSPLFAEIADNIVPVAVEAKSSMFYGTSVRGYKWLDSVFFLMNPAPEYNLQFLENISGLPASRKSSYESANYVQKLIGDALGFQCTNLTRGDKYRMLAGGDGRARKI